MALETLTVELGPRSYPILIGSDGIGPLGRALRERTSHERVLVVSDNRVGSLYGEAALASLSEAGFLAETLIIPEGEVFKTLDTCLSVYGFLLSNNYSRETVLVALQGYQATSGPSIAIVNLVTAANGDVMVFIQESTLPGMMPAVSNPYHIVAVPRVSGMVSFVQHEGGPTPMSGTPS